MTEDLRPPFRQQFDNARDPYTARNALGITSTGGGGSGFITAVTPPLQVTGTTLSIDLSAYLTTASAAATYQPLDADLTAIAALTGTNVIYYRSAANTWSAVTVGTGLTFTGGTLAAATATSTISQPQGRLTLLTGTPVMTTTQAGRTTIYYTPYIGNLVPIYDGTNFIMTNIPGGVSVELSVSTTDTTKSPAAIGASKCNDWFVWMDGSTMRIGHGPDWTNDTTRSAGTALVMVLGTLLNNAAITNGPAAQRGTYVGTTRSNASSQLDWIYGTSAAGGGAAFHGVWNCYNRVPVSTLVQSSDASWSYAAANTWRAVENSATFRAQLVVGLDEDAIQAIYYGQVTAGASTIALSGIGLDSTTTATDVRGQSSLAGFSSVCIAGYYGYVGLGFHYLSALERNSTTTGSTWTGLSANDCQSGLAVTFWA